jgi:hypothetical protein
VFLPQLIRVGDLRILAISSVGKTPRSLTLFYLHFTQPPDGSRLPLWTSAYHGVPAFAAAATDQAHSVVTDLIWSR